MWWERVLQTRVAFGSPSNWKLDILQNPCTFLACLELRTRSDSGRKQWDAWKCGTDITSKSEPVLSMENRLIMVQESQCDSIKRWSFPSYPKKAWHQPKKHMSQLLCSSATGRIHRTPNLSTLRWFGMQGSSKNYSGVDNFIVCSYSRMIVYFIDHRHCRPPKLIHTDTPKKKKKIPGDW